MYPVDPLDGLPQAVRSLEGVGHMNAPDHQDLVLGNDITTHFGSKIPPADRDLTRFQRAGKSANQSTAGCCNHIIQRSCMRHRDLLAPASIMFCDRAMSAEQDRFRFCRQISEPDKLFLATLNAYSRDVDGLFFHRQPFWCPLGGGLLGRPRVSSPPPGGPQSLSAGEKVHSWS